MDAKFDKIHKFLSNLDKNAKYNFFSSNGEDIKEISIFNEDNSLKNELLTKDGFINNLFSNVGRDKEYYENLYYTIANLDDNPEMSEDELKFIASFANDNKQNLINREDFYEIGLIGKDSNKYIEENNGIGQELEATPITKIVSQESVEKLENITAVNEELKINGIIDEPIIQGNVGSCWLLAGINSLNSTENGKQIIRNSIIPNKDGTVTIKFAGIDTQITLTADEIKEHDTDTNISDNYSNGDNDALVLEMAMQKLIKKNPKLLPGLDKGISGGQNFDLWKVLIPNHDITHINKFLVKRDTNGVPYENKENSLFKNKIKSVFNQALNNKNIVMSFSIPGHSMAIIEVNKNEVTFIDSMDNRKTKVSWDDFIDNYTINFSYTDLSNI